MKLLELDNKAFNYYRNNVKGNQCDTYELAQKKMTRNMILAYKALYDPDKHYAQMYCYGSLHFWVINNKVVGIRNNQPTSRGWQLNQSKYKKLNKKLGIVKKETIIDKIKRLFYFN